MEQLILNRWLGSEPLSPAEEALWRALMRIVKALPRNLDADLVRTAGCCTLLAPSLLHSQEWNRAPSEPHLARSVLIGAASEKDRVNA